MPGMTAQYSHGGPECRAKLRDAVDRLDRAYPMNEFVGKFVGEDAAKQAATAKVIE
jgi:hypothetical protein